MRFLIVIFAFTAQFASALEPAKDSTKASEPTKTEAAIEEPKKAKPQKEAEPVEPILQVEWYHPEVKRSGRKGRARVVLTGKTLPHSKAIIGYNKIPVIDKDGNTKYVSSKDIFKARQVKADEYGLFEMDLMLPIMKAQLPIKMRSPKGQVKDYQMTLDVDKENAKFQNQEAMKNSPYSLRKWESWIGTGGNFLFYTQRTSDIPSSLELKTFKLPSLYLKQIYNQNSAWNYHGTLSLSPGEAKSSSSVNVSDGTYYWTIIDLGANYFPKNWSSMFLKKYETRTGLTFGIQNHFVPFISRSSSSDEEEARIVKNSITMLTAGAKAVIKLRRRWMAETFLRMQYPIASGNVFDVSPEFSFDGSVGVFYKWMPDLRAGLFAYGQWHKYKFSNHEDKYFKTQDPTKNPINGDQSLFFSNIEFRLGYEFDSFSWKSFSKAIGDGFSDIGRRMKSKN